MKDAVIGLATLLLILTGFFLKSAVHTLMIMLVLWLVGTLWPFVAHALCLPFQTLYDLFMHVLVGIKALFALGVLGASI